jgi:hypothetical protein
MEGNDKMLKFENTAQVGQHIRAYDFEPMPDRSDRYVEGEVIERDVVREFGAIGYLIRVTKDALYDEGQRTEVFVPYGISFGEFDSRVMLADPEDDGAPLPRQIGLPTVPVELNAVELLTLANYAKMRHDENSQEDYRAQYYAAFFGGLYRKLQDAKNKVAG